MNIERMKSIPETRSEFERNFHILEEQFRNKKIFFSKDINTDSLLKVRKLPNNRIDFLTVDEMARLNANMSANMIDIEINKDQQYES